MSRDSDTRFTISAIQAFLKNGPWIDLINALTSTSKFNWRGYTQTVAFNPIPDGPMTLDVVANWLLTYLYRKPTDDDPKVDHTPSFHRVFQFLRDNSYLVETHRLLQFLATFQESRIQKIILPSWFELALVPLFREEFIPKNPILVEDAFRRFSHTDHALWENLVQALTLQYVPFWLNTSEYIMKFLLYELLQTLDKDTPLIPGTPKNRADIIQKFLAGKLVDFFKFFHADLLIFLAHHHFLTLPFIRQILFNRSRRENYRLNSLWTWLYSSSVKNSIILSFLKDEFRSFHAFTIRRNQLPYFSNFANLFVHPHHFFEKLMENPDILKESGIHVKEMEKFFHIFFWTTSTFFPMLNYERYFYTLMDLPSHWRNLLVQLYRCEIDNTFECYKISVLVRTVLKSRNVYFDKTLFDTCSFYMKNVVMKSSRILILKFVKWLFQQSDLSILVHFPFNAELIQLIQQIYPDVRIGRYLFWSLFLTECVGKYQGPERSLTIEMEPVCARMCLQITEQELNLSNSPESMKTPYMLYLFFGVIQLNLNFGDFFIVLNFPNSGYCHTILDLPSLDPFRFLVISLKNALNKYKTPEPIQNKSDKLKALIKDITENQDFMQHLTDVDRKFLKNLFHSYLPTIIITDELLRLLRELSFLFPSDVKQAMFEDCRPLKMLDNEIKRLAEEQSECGQKRSRDPSDQSSYEAKCSLCRKFYPLSEIGIDDFGDTLCRPCSQSSGMKIRTLLVPFDSPFASL
jgi:hypothetical protein